MLRGTGFVVINSNDASAFPEDGMQNMVGEKQKRNHPLPISSTILRELLCPMMPPAPRISVFWTVISG